MSSDRIKEAAFELSKFGCVGYSGWFGINTCVKRLRRKLEVLLRKHRGGVVIDDLAEEVADLILSTWVLRTDDEELKQATREEIRALIEYFFSQN